MMNGFSSFEKKVLIAQQMDLFFFLLELNFIYLRVVYEWRDL